MFSQTNYDSLRLEKRYLFTNKPYDSSKKNLKIKNHTIFLSKRYNFYVDSTENNLHFENKRYFNRPSIVRREGNNN